jgi:flagellar motor switch protein FliM
MDTNNEMPPGQAVLTQSQAEQTPVEVGQGETPKQPPGPLKAFRQSAFLAESQLRKLRSRQEGFVRALAARLSLYLRLEFGLQSVGLKTVSFQKFIETMLTPTHLTLFKIEPLRGICLLEIPPRLGLTLADRLLGGPAQSGDPKAGLGEIEVALLDQIVQIILSEWCSQWSDLQELKPSLLGHEIDSRFLQTTARDNLMLEVALEASLGDCKEQFRMGFPYRSLELLLRQLSATIEVQTKDEIAPPAAAEVKWNQIFDEIPVPITAELHGVELTAGEVAHLKVGDTIPLQPHQLNSVVLRLAQTPKFIGNLGKSSQKWAVEVTQILETNS